MSIDEEVYCDLLARIYIKIESRHHFFTSFFDSGSSGLDRVRFLLPILREATARTTSR
jgi:hypothetical protein